MSSPETAGKAVAAAGAPELGIDIDAETLRAVSAAHSITWQPGSRDAGIAIHVALGRVGWEADDILDAWRLAVGRHEASELVVCGWDELAHLQGEWAS